MLIVGPEPQSNEDDEHRDVYAHFGSAYFLAECVHRGLVNAYALLSSTPGNTTRPRVEELYARADSMTMGALVTLVKPLLPAALGAQLDSAVECRNHLAHGF